MAAYVRDQLLPCFAAYMVAARRLYQGGEDLQGVAREQALNQGILERWVDYLNPRGDFRPYLEDWRRVDDAAAGNLATEYRVHLRGRPNPLDPRIEGVEGRGWPGRIQG